MQKINKSKLLINNTNVILKEAFHNSRSQLFNAIDL